jgi:hypothetical protein
MTEGEHPPLHGMFAMGMACTLCTASMSHAVWDIDKFTTSGR